MNQQTMISSEFLLDKIFIRFELVFLYNHWQNFAFKSECFILTPSKDVNTWKSIILSMKTIVRSSRECWNWYYKDRKEWKNINSQIKAKLKITGFYFEWTCIRMYLFSALSRWTDCSRQYQLNTGFGYRISFQRKRKNTRIFGQLFITISLKNDNSIILR